MVNHIDMQRIYREMMVEAENNEDAKNEAQRRIFRYFMEMTSHGLYPTIISGDIIDDRRDEEETPKQIQIPTWNSRGISWKSRSKEGDNMNDFGCRGSSCKNNETKNLPWEKSPKEGHLYRNALNREMRDERAIKEQENLHWQDKTKPESNKYYTRLCDGNYRRIGDSAELPEHIQGKDFAEMQEYISYLEEKVIELEELNEDYFPDEEEREYARLIERSESRYEREAKLYREKYDREHSARLTSLAEIDKLKREVMHLKKTGFFPDTKERMKGATDREKRFAGIDF